MAKRRMIQEKEILRYLQEEGFGEVTEAARRDGWYKKASERPSCLRGVHKTSEVKPDNKM